MRADQKRIVEFHILFTVKAYNRLVAEPCAVLDEFQDEAARLEPVKLAEYVRAKLNLAIQLACEAEHERRSGHWQAAVEYQRQWEEAIAEVKWLFRWFGTAACHFLQWAIRCPVPGKCGDEKQPGHSEIPFVAVVENGA
jgi:hypothetical protein